jgi:hypothetical protein
MFNTLSRIILLVVCTGQKICLDVQNTHVFLRPKRTSDNSPLEDKTTRLSLNVGRLLPTVVKPHPVRMDIMNLILVYEIELLERGAA